MPSWPGHQSLGHLARHALRLLAHLLVNLLEVLDLLLGLVDVGLDHPLELLTRGLLKHLLLGLEEPVLSIVDVRQLVKELLLKVRDGHRPTSSFVAFCSPRPVLASARNTKAAKV